MSISKNNRNKARKRSRDLRAWREEQAKHSKQSKANLDEALNPKKLPEYLYEKKKDNKNLVAKFKDLFRRKVKR